MDNHVMVLAKAGFTATISGICAWLGWKGLMALVWILFMTLDYISGTAAAMKDGEWSSARAREGLWHKGGMIIVVIVAAIGDVIMTVICGNIPVLGIQWPGFLLPLVLAWYILTESGSILENAIKLGAQVPEWMTKVLKASLKAVDGAGDSMTIEDEERPEVPQDPAHPN